MTECISNAFALAFVFKFKQTQQIQYPSDLEFSVGCKTGFSGLVCLKIINIKKARAIRLFLFSIVFVFVVIL